MLQQQHKKPNAKSAPKKITRQRGKEATRSLIWHAAALNCQSIFECHCLFVLPRMSPTIKAKRETSSSCVLYYLLASFIMWRILWAPIIFYESSIIYYTNNIKIVYSTLCFECVYTSHTGLPLTKINTRRKEKKFTQSQWETFMKTLCLLNFTKQEIRKDHNFRSREEWKNNSNVYLYYHHIIHICTLMLFLEAARIWS